VIEENGRRKHVVPIPLSGIMMMIEFAKNKFKVKSIFSILVFIYTCRRSYVCATY
jgi:hypothetical protein